MCPSMSERGGKAATVSIRSPAFLCEVPHCCGLGTQKWKDFQLSSSTQYANNHRHSFQVLGIFVLRLRHSSFPSCMQFPTLTPRTAHIGHSPDKNVPMFKPSTPIMIIDTATQRTVFSEVPLAALPHHPSNGFKNSLSALFIQKHLNCDILKKKINKQINFKKGSKDQKKIYVKRQLLWWTEFTS